MANIEKQLKRLNRRELLEMMLEQSKRIDDLKKENERLKAELESKTILIENSGSLVEAAVRISGVFEAAQQAADLYLENVKASAAKASAAPDGEESGTKAAGPDGEPDEETENKKDERPDGEPD